MPMKSKNAKIALQGGQQQEKKKEKGLKSEYSQASSSPRWAGQHFYCRL